MRALWLVVSRSEPLRKPPRTVHLCPDCGRRILWALAYCALCRWRGRPDENDEWVAPVRRPA